MERRIENIVFDMGGVLFHTDRFSLCMEYAPSHEDAEAVESALFDSVEWLLLDRGTITLAEAEARVCRRLPERLHGALRGVLAAWHTVGSPLPGMEPLIRALKAAGYGVYLLSNTATTFHTRLKPLLPAIECFDGACISADCHLLKPDLAIYRVFLSTFSLAAESCVFIDDSIANVEAAMYVGMRAVHFQGDADALASALYDLGIRF